MLPTQPSTPVERRVIAWMFVAALILGGLASLIIALRLPQDQQELHSSLLTHGVIALSIGAAAGATLLWYHRHDG